MRKDKKYVLLRKEKLEQVCNVYCAPVTERIK